MEDENEITIRTDLRPGDFGAVISLHGILHGREFGFDATFEAYVAAPLAEFVQRASPRCAKLSQRGRPACDSFQSCRSKTVVAWSAS